MGRIDAVPAILDVVCRVTGMGFAAVARVREEQCVACGVLDNIAFGVEAGDELKLDDIKGAHASKRRAPLIINDVAHDEGLHSRPTSAQPSIRSYISMPIILTDGTFFGTLCALDRRPARLDPPEILGMFRLFAELISSHLMAARRLVASEASLADERKTSALREQFIAVLGHDLRNPLASIDAGMKLLRRTLLDERTQRIVGLVESSVRRMGHLIDNVLDFARGRLGGGLTLERSPAISLLPMLMQIVAELQASWPSRTFETHFDLPSPVDCDQGRIGQLFSNLLANALTYGSLDGPVRAAAFCSAGAFELWVANSGRPINPAALERLFQPYARGAVRPSQQGLGLGLYICSEIAKAHGGDIKVISSEKETRFTFRMPLTAPPSRNGQDVV